MLEECEGALPVNCTYATRVIALVKDSTFVSFAMMHCHRYSSSNPQLEGFFCSQSTI